MSYFPILKAAKLIPILTRMGFKIMRQKGSHIHLEHFADKTRKITVPMHNKDLAKKTLLSIIKQGKISIREFVEILKM